VPAGEVGLPSPNGGPMTTKSTREVLADVPLFKALSDEELEAVEKIAQTKTFKANDILIEEDSSGGAFFVVLSGRVDVEIRPPLSSDPPQRIATLKPGEVVGELSLVDGHRRSASARAISAVDALALDEKQFRALMQREPAIGFKVMRELARVLSARVRDTNLKLRNALSDLISY
jgi:CRP-like cAMP-binding protein